MIKLFGEGPICSSYPEGGLCISCLQMKAGMQPTPIGHMETKAMLSHKVTKATLGHKETKATLGHKETKATLGHMKTKGHVKPHK